jgi:SOS response regulatory protein OraA/RecX
VNDSLALESYLHARGNRLGCGRVRMELAARGFDRALVDEALESRDDDSERELLRRHLRTKARQLAGLDPARRKRRLFAALSRLGFSRSMIFEEMGESEEN